MLTLLTAALINARLLKTLRLLAFSCGLLSVNGLMQQWLCFQLKFSPTTTSSYVLCGDYSWAQTLIALALITTAAVRGGVEGGEVEG